MQLQDNSRDLAGMATSSPQTHDPIHQLMGESHQRQVTDPKNRKSEPIRTSPSIVFQQGAQQRNPSSRRKDKSVADTRSSTYWERKPLCLQNEPESISSLYSVRSAEENGRCEKWRCYESKTHMWWKPFQLNLTQPTHQINQYSPFPL